MRPGQAQPFELNLRDSVEINITNLNMPLITPTSTLSKSKKIFQDENTDLLRNQIRQTFETSVSSRRLDLGNSSTWDADFQLKQNELLKTIEELIAETVVKEIQARFQSIEEKLNKKLTLIESSYSAYLFEKNEKIREAAVAADENVEQNIAPESLSKRNPLAPFPYVMEKINDMERALARDTEAKCKDLFKYLIHQSRLFENNDDFRSKLFSLDAKINGLAKSVSMLESAYYGQAERKALEQREDKRLLELKRKLEQLENRVDSQLNELGRNLELELSSKVNLNDKIFPNILNMITDCEKSLKILEKTIDQKDFTMRELMKKTKEEWEKAIKDIWDELMKIDK